MNELKELLKGMWLPMLAMFIMLLVAFSFVSFELRVWGECLEKNSFPYCLRTLG